MTASDIFSQSAPRRAGLNSPASGPARLVRPDVWGAGLQADGVAERDPARVVILGPALGACLWAALIYGLYALS